jgi:hypothetical protein
LSKIWQENRSGKQMIRDTPKLEFTAGVDCTATPKPLAKLQATGGKSRPS